MEDPRSVATTLRSGDHLCLRRERLNPEQLERSTELA
jgi:hypothetical protein